MFASDDPAAVVLAARRAEGEALDAAFRISRHDGPAPLPVYTDLLRIARWQPRRDRLPAADPGSFWLEDVRRSARMLVAANRLQAAIDEAVCGTVISETEAAYLFETMSGILARCQPPSSSGEFPHRPLEQGPR